MIGKLIFDEEEVHWKIPYGEGRNDYFTVDASDYPDEFLEALRDTDVIFDLITVQKFTGSYLKAIISI